MSISGLRDRQIITSSWKQTFNWGRKVGTYLKGGDLILCQGPLGSGKTIFVKGIASSLGIDPQEVDSASFLLLKVYEGREALFHFDFFRLQRTENIWDCDFFESLNQGIVVVEWPQLLKGFLEGYEYLEVNFKHSSPNERCLQFYPHGRRFAEILGRIRHGR